MVLCQRFQQSVRRGSELQSILPISQSNPLLRAYFNFRNRYHKLTTPTADKSILFDDFVLKVPRKNKQIIRLRLFDFIRMKDRDMRTWCIFTLFIRTAIYCITNKVSAYATIVKQGVALTRSTVTSN